MNLNAFRFHKPISLDGSDAGKVYQDDPPAAPRVNQFCTPELRWNNGILEQKWTVETYWDPRSSCPTKQSQDWRAVPNITDRVARIAEAPPAAAAPKSKEKSGVDYQPFVYGHK